MKIAIVTHHVVKGEGQGRVNYEIARYLLARGAQVDLVAYKVDQDLIDAGATWTFIDAGLGGDAVDLIKVWRFKRRANRFIERHRNAYDAILSCGACLTVPHDLNAAHFVHGTWLRSPFHASKVRRDLRGAYQGFFAWLNARWELEAYGAARQVVAVSEMVRHELIEIGVQPDKIETVVNGVDPVEFVPGAGDRDALGLPRDGVLGFFAGDIESPIKNLDTLLYGLAEVPGVDLAVAGFIGTSPYPELAEHLGIGDRVHFLGYRRDIADLMRAADFFALPSRRDSCPLVMLEAMATGLPVLTSKMVGTHDLVGAEAGFVMRTPDDMETLCQALQAFRDDPSARARMGARAREVACEHSWDEMAAQYARLLRRSESAHRPPALAAA